MKSLLRMILLNLASVLLARNLKRIGLYEYAALDLVIFKAEWTRSEDLLVPVELDKQPEVDILGLGLSPPHLPVLVVPHVDRHRF